MANEFVPRHLQVIGKARTGLAHVKAYTATARRAYWIGLVSPALLSENSATALTEVERALDELDRLVQMADIQLGLDVVELNARTEESQCKLVKYTC
jgi:hypothetical protein